MLDSRNIVLVIQNSSQKTALWKAALSKKKIVTISDLSKVSLLQIKKILVERGDILPDLILVDLGLENLDAFELCYWCSKNHPELKVIITSDLETILPYDRHWAIDRGAWDILPKLQTENLEISIENNLSCVLKHLDGHQFNPDTSILSSNSNQQQALYESQDLLISLDRQDIKVEEKHLTLINISESSDLQSLNHLSSVPTQESQSKQLFHSSSPIPRKTLFLILLGIISIVLGLIWWLVLHSRSQPAIPAQDSSLQHQNNLTQKVVARGKIIPEMDVIKLSVPNAQDSRVDRIFVKQGDRVRANQVIAILQGAEQRKTELETAQANVNLLKAKLEKVKQGEEKPATFEVQQSVLDRLRNQASVEIDQKQSEITSALASANEARGNYNRQQTLYSQGAVSRAELDKARKDFEVAQASLTLKRADLKQSRTTSKSQIVEEQAKLEELQQVRPVDIAIAQRELEKSILEAERSRFGYEDTLVRVPVAGQILRINTKVGEQVNTELGIVDLGRTQQMYVQAEIYETDLAKVRKAQRASIVSEYGGFEGEIHGTVNNVDLQVGKPTLQEEKNNPTTDDNSRVVQVSIRIDPADSAKVSGLTKMQVRVTIEPNPRST